jgi:serine phosphatase RsbU (regulator of sigma subunit)
MFPNQKFSVADLNLERGDSLLLYTDGVPDARGNPERVTTSFDR